MVEKLNKRCLECGKEFMVYPSLNRVNYCSQKCYRIQRWKNYQKPQCEICGSRNHTCKYKGWKILCRKHINQIVKYGKIFQRTRSTRNEIIDRGDYYEMKLYNVNHQEIARAKFSKDKLNTVSKYKWSLSRCNGGLYVGNGFFRMHTLIMGKMDGFVIDHINNDGLDNRNENLRFLTHGDNIWRSRREKK